MSVSGLSQETKDKSTEAKASAAPVNEAKGTVQELASSVAQTLQDVASNAVN